MAWIGEIQLQKRTLFLAGISRVLTADYKEMNCSKGGKFTKDSYIIISFHIIYYLLVQFANIRHSIFFCANSSNYVKRTMFLGHSVCIGIHKVKEMKLDSNLLIIRISIVLTE